MRHPQSSPRKLRFHIDPETAVVGFVHSEPAASLAKALGAVVISNAPAVSLSAGEATLYRASHVEPRGDKWVADMSPSSGAVGPFLGPFDTREEALSEEIDYLQEKGF